MHGACIVQLQHSFKVGSFCHSLSCLIYCTAAEEEDPSFLATRRRSSLLAAPRVEYAPFLEAAQRALEDNKNEYLALFKKCGPILRAWPLRRKVVAKYLEGSISHGRCADARSARQIHIWCASAKTPLQNF